MGSSDRKAGGSPTARSCFTNVWPVQALKALDPEGPHARCHPLRHHLAILKNKYQEACISILHRVL